MFLGDIDLSSLSEKHLTQVRRDKIGFIFQTYNLIPTLTALENITLPMALAGRNGDQAWIDRIVDTVGLAPAAQATARRSSRAVSSSASRSHARSRASPRSSSPTSPPATSTRAPAPRSSTFMRKAVQEFGQTIVMVTHDPTAAAYAGRVIFLADGKIVDEIREPTAQAILDKMHRLGE